MNTKKTLLQLIKKDFKNVSWKSAKYISKGYDHDIIILDNRIVFRFPKNNYSKKLLKGEIGLLNFLEKRIDIPLPVYTYIANNYSCGGYQMINGKGLSRKTYNTLSTSQKSKLAKHIAIFLSQLHATPLSKIAAYQIRERHAQKELRQLHKDAEKFLYPTSSLREQKKYEVFFSELTNVLQQTHKKVLVHGDFSMDHIIIDEKNAVAGIIDFTDRAIHDPAFDFIFLWELGPSFTQAVYSHYNGEKAGILQRSKIYAQGSAIWNMIHSIQMKKSDYEKWHRKFKKMNVLKF